MTFVYVFCTPLVRTGCRSFSPLCSPEPACVWKEPPDQRAVSEKKRVGVDIPAERIKIKCVSSCPRMLHERHGEGFFLLSHPATQLPPLAYPSSFDVV